MRLPNIIMIVIDALRKDYARLLEEKLRKLGFISYDNVIAPSPWTTPSHASLFTGLYPLYHGAHETKTMKYLDIKLKRENLLINIELSRMGYETYLMSANPFVSPNFGFVGFDYYYQPSYLTYLSVNLLKKNESFFLARTKAKYGIKNRLELLKFLLIKKHYGTATRLIMNFFAKKVVIRAILKIFKKWPKDKGSTEIIKKVAKINFNTLEPKFVFINLMEVHEPHELNLLNEISANKLRRIDLLMGNIDQRLINNWRICYHNQVKYVTEKILSLINVLKKKRIFKNSLIIVTSDHGELLGEHGKLEHGVFLFDELLRIPLLIKYPDGVKVKINENRDNLWWISLTKLKAHIMEILYKREATSKSLFSDTVFAESFGSHIPLNDVTSDSEQRVVDDIEKYRIAIYHKQFKGIFNVSDWRFEEITSYSPTSSINPKVKAILKTKIVNYLRNAVNIRTVKRKILRDF
ncbi:MAG: sulfatase-like hydrolase/transferase [Candidatus Njordarchaeales archaeon]